MLQTHVCEEYDLAGSPIFGDERPVVWLDIETRKIAVNNWVQKTRWETFMIAVAWAADPGVMNVEVVSGTEAELVDYMEQMFEGCEIRYVATREFDEMVLRGRFTNARRAHNPVAGRWPNLNKFDCKWLNIRKGLKAPEYVRSADVASRDVPSTWDAGQKEIVIKHCMRDVVENVLLDPEIEMTPALRAELVALMV